MCASCAGSSYGLSLTRITRTCAPWLRCQDRNACQIANVEGPVAVAALTGGGFVISWSGIAADGVRSNYGRVFPGNALLGMQ
jgi:hypothetical protein